MSEEYLSSVAFITPLCLLGITSVVQVLRLGRKLAVTRSFELEDSEFDDFLDLICHPYTC